MIASGAAAVRFAEAVRDRVGAVSVATAASGLDALAAALRGCAVGAGDEVIVPTYVCARVTDAVIATGARPTLADVGVDGNLTVETVQAVRTVATKAVIAVHTFGHPCDLAALRSLGLMVVEDACQAFAISLPAGVTGTLGDVGVYSFQATKCLATGEGGMIVTPVVTTAGVPQGHTAMADLQATLGLAQLARYDSFLDRRRAIAAVYRDAVSARPELAAHQPDSDIPLFRFTLRSPSGFEQAVDFFASRGIAARRGVDALLHRAAGLADRQFPTATRLFETTVSLPFYPGLSDAQVERIAAAARAFARVH
jgi:UDP-4-amino-4-deoxy-L-arabinose-oxoglutarate aminotransferase